jgi:hypothetical protein
MPVRYRITTYPRDEGRFACPRPVRFHLGLGTNARVNIRIVNAEGQERIFEDKQLTSGGEFNDPEMKEFVGGGGRRIEVTVWRHPDCPRWQIPEPQRTDRRYEILEIVEEP